MNIAAITLESPGELLLSLGPLQVHWYGIMIAAAFLAGLWVVLYLVKNDEYYKINSDEIINLSMLLLIGGIIFARLYYVIFQWDYFSQHPLEIFMTWHGGLSIHGVIIGCPLILLTYTAFKKHSFLKYTDLFAFGLIIGQFIGRWGNFFNSEAVGLPTDSFLRVFIAPEYRPHEYIQYEFFHPTFLYESIYNLVVFLILFLIIRKNFKHINGVITCSYLVLYSLGRYFIEGLRLDNIYSVAGMHLAQYISLIIILVGIIGLFGLYFRQKYWVISRNVTKSDK